MGLEQIKVELLNSWQGPKGGDGTIAHAAWASTFDAEKLSAKSDDDIRRIVTNVVDHHHDTPKERLWMEFFITAPLFSERQLDKYRMTVQYQDFQVEFFQRPMGADHITQNELSGRYRTIPERAYGTPDDVTQIFIKADPDFYNQGSNEVAKMLAKSKLDLLLQDQWKIYKMHLTDLKEAEQAGKISNAEYKRAREVIRGILGTSFLTDFRISLNLNAFEHIINQRLSPTSQTESRVVAYHMLKTALDGSIANVAINRMAVANGWSPWMSEVRGWLDGQNNSL